MLSEGEEQQLLAALQYDYPTQLAIRLYITSGMRRMEAIELTWPSIRPEGIELERTKTGKPRTISYNLSLSGVLEDCRKLSQRGHVLRNGEGKPYADSEKALAALERSIRRGISRAKIRKGRGSLFNLFRHTTGSRLAERGASFGQIANILGNTAQICEKYYIHWSKQAGAATMALLDRPMEYTFTDRFTDRTSTGSTRGSVN